MTKTRTILITSFVLVFLAGIPFGWAIDHWSDSPNERSWLGRRLDLTSEQEKEISQIWSEVSQTSHSERRDTIRRLSEEHDEDIQKILTEEQKTRFEEIGAKHRKERNEYFEHVKAMNDEAVEKTMDLLSEEQRAKYEAIIEHRRGGSRNGFGPGHGSGHPGSQ